MKNISFLVGNEKYIDRRKKDLNVVLDNLSDAEVTRMQSDLWLVRRLGLICDRKLLTVSAAHTKGLCCWHFVIGTSYVDVGRQGP